MAQVSTTNPADFANRRQIFFSKELLKELEFNLRMAQFAEKKSAPATGFLAIRFFRVRKARKAGGGVGPANLTEGVQNLRKSEVSIGNLDCYLNQRGDDFEITDIVRATDLLDTLKIYMKTLGQDAALDLDQVITNSLMGDATTTNKAKALGLGAAQTTLFNSNNTYGIATAPYFERFAGIANTGNSANDFATFNALTAANAKFTRLEHLRALTQLRSNDVKPPDGKVFPVIVAPQVKFDIRQDATLVAAMTQRDNAKLYKYEEFELDGGAFIESTNPWQEKNTYGTYDVTGGNFTNLYIGDDAYGTVKLSNNIAGGDPTAPKITVLDTADKSDRYNQLVAGSWKVFYGSILKITSDPSDCPHVVASRVKTTFQ
jgi:N4-gp56 family major capsid protein